MTGQPTPSPNLPSLPEIRPFHVLINQWFPFIRPHQTLISEGVDWPAIIYMSANNGSYRAGLKEWPGRYRCWQFVQTSKITNPLRDVRKPLIEIFWGSCVFQTLWGNSFQKVRGTFLNRKADSFTTQNPGRFSRLSPDTNLQKAAKDTGTSPWKMNGFNRYFHFSRLVEGNWSKNHPPPGKVRHGTQLFIFQGFFSRVP